MCRPEVAPATRYRPGAWQPPPEWWLRCRVCHTRARAHLPPHLEAIELRDFNARDLSPTPKLNAVLHDALTDAEIDAMFVTEMERRDRAVACPEGYRDAACEACGTALYVLVGQSGDVPCPQCQCQGTALAGEDDDDPRPLAAGAMHPDYRYFADLASRLPGDLQALLRVPGGVAVRRTVA
jgi:hypothetical protein